MHSGSFEVRFDGGTGRRELICGSVGVLGWCMGGWVVGLVSGAWLDWWVVHGWVGGAWVGGWCMGGWVVHGWVGGACLGGRGGACLGGWFMVGWVGWSIAGWT